MNTLVHRHRWLLLALAMLVAHNVPANNHSEALRQAEVLMQDGNYDAARQAFDSLHAEFDSTFNREYDSQIVPVRLEYNAHEAQLNADRDRTRLMWRIALGTLVMCVVGFLLSLLVRREYRRLAASQQEMKTATERAEMAEKSKSMFLSNMTHEIRTPLNAIAGFTEVLACEGIDEDTRRESAEIIEMNSSLLQNLIDDVVDTACMDLREMKFRIVACDVVKLSRNVTEMISHIKKTDAEMRFETTDSSLVIMADPLRLQQVLVNVLVNATKFCKQGSITMRVESDDKGARVSVTDTGIGIPPEKQATVFRRFERVKENAEGFGLGLSICQFIIERMGGRIWVDGEYTGGARFVFTLPFEQPTEEGGIA